MTTTQDRPPVVTVPRRSPVTARWLRLARHTAQAAVAGIVVWQVSNEFSGGKAEGICPFGGFETLWTWLTTGRLVSHVRPANLAVAAAILVMAVAGRSFFCGWACPLGAIQGAIYAATSAVVDRIGPLRRLRRRVERAAGRRGGFTRHVDRALRYGRYAVLAWALMGAAVHATMVWREYDPWHALISVAEFEFSTAFVVLLVVLVVSMVLPRPFCRYACPLGALQGLAAKASPVAIQRDADACLGCDLCNRACPVGIQVNQLSRVTDSNCLGCLECVAACPSRDALGVTFALPFPAGEIGARPKVAPGTLRLPARRRVVPTRTRLRTRRVSLLAYVAVLLALPVALLIGADQAGWLVNKGRFVPSTALGAKELGVAGRDFGGGGGGAEQRRGGEGESRGGETGGESGQRGAATASVAVGSLNPDDVRGSMTMQQVLDAFPKVTAAELCRQFGVPADTPTSTQLKSLAQLGNGYEVSELREWLKSRS